jgi:hypothetical protein
MTTWKDALNLLPEEEILIAYPFKPESILVVTNQRVIGHRQFAIGMNRFAVDVFFKDIVKLRYLPGKHFLLGYLDLPSLTISYLLPDARIESATLHFPGKIARRSDPRSVYNLVVEQVNRVKGSNWGRPMG